MPFPQTFDSLAKHFVPRLLRTDSNTATALAFQINYIVSASIPARDEAWSYIFAELPNTAVLLQLVRAVEDGRLPVDLPSANLDETAIAIGQLINGDDFTAFSVAEMDLLMYLMTQPREWCPRFRSDGFTEAFVRQSHSSSGRPSNRSCRVSPCAWRTYRLAHCRALRLQISFFWSRLVGFWLTSSQCPAMPGAPSTMGSASVRSRLRTS